MIRENCPGAGKAAVIGAMVAAVVAGAALWPADGKPNENGESASPAAARDHGRGHCGRDVTVADPRAKLPLAFVENQGQWDTDARFLATCGAVRAAFFTQGLTLTREQRDGDRRHGVAVRLTFENAAPRAAVTGVHPLPGRFNFYLGDDSRRWRTGVIGYRQVQYQGLYQGLGIRFRDRGRHLEYDVELDPGADLEQVVIRCEGIQGLDLEGDGTLVMHTAAGSIRQKPPATWHVLPDGGRQAVRCRYRMLDASRYGFAVAEREPALAMVIDPGLEWSTYVGGAGYDYATDVAVDAAGSTTVCGYTESSDFPTVAGSYDLTFNGRMDAFVARLDATGSKLVFSTFLGGSSADFAAALALTGTGEVVVSGFTQSRNFPTTGGAYSTSSPGNGDAFVVRLNGTGSALKFSTFLGGSRYDQPFDLALGAGDDVIVVGLTQSSDFPTTVGAFDRSFNGADDGFIARLDASGSKLVFSTFLGGSGKEPATAVAVDTSGAVTVAGEAWGVNNTSDFPTTSGSYDPSYNGGSSDTYVVRVDSTGSTLVYSTFLGGAGGDPVRDLRLHPNGAVTLAGQTYSSDFPTTKGAYDTTYGGNGDVYVARLNGSGTRLEYGTFLGGSDFDEGTAVAVDASGAVTVAGWTKSSDYPTTPGAGQATNQGLGDCLVTRLNPAGDKLIYSTYHGGTRYEIPNSLALDHTNAATIAGELWSLDFPTTPGAYDTGYNSWGDAFVSRLDLLPKGVSRYGRSTPSCKGPIALGVNRLPVAGAFDFVVTCINAPPNSIGVLALGFVPSVPGVPIANILVHVNPTLPYLPLYALSDGNGSATVNIPIPAGTRGVKAYCQMIWANTASCPGSGILSASNALEIEVQ
jgi:hypothetical protein